MTKTSEVFIPYVSSEYGLFQPLVLKKPQPFQLDDLGSFEEMGWHTNFDDAFRVAESMANDLGAIKGRPVSPDRYLGHGLQMFKRDRNSSLESDNHNV